MLPPHDSSRPELIAPETAAANDLTRRWLAARAEAPAVASGLGIWPLLCMLATGATGETRDELLAAAGVTLERAALAPKALLDAAETTASIRLALGVWAGERVTLDPEWVAGLPSGTADSLTGVPAVDKAALDAWAAEHTDGLIPEMPLDFSKPVDIALASALLVRTRWLTPFTEGQWAFASGPWSELGRCRTLTTMLRDDVLRISDDASVLTIPGDGDIDVLLCIGREDLAPQQVLTTLIDAATAPDWGRSATALEPGDQAVGVTAIEYMGSSPQTGPEVRVQTVGFQLDADLDLGQDAAALGLTLATDKDRARFGRLAVPNEPGARLYVSQAKQTATATFSATGFEAAVITAMAMEAFGGVPVFDHRHRAAEIRFDRPFAYLARHRTSGLVIVAGWVDRPEAA
ncbi:serpin family protein [Glycomyces harbinensis]|uniref:Serine protease inhibitor n=1 Tax=Glycomyces harbinensis TaxID=58114 RepID=A0A1G7DUU2_9ACTN|nr:serpin family protein [Glycomyces harbinensis]SDE54906.1 Serine protease inhibitor [Glycomyces harbinensis]